MVNAYGFLEVKGLATGIEAADAMVKAAHVRLVAQLKTDPGFITLVVEGDIGACGAAIHAGRAAAARVGEVVSERLIGRPEPDIDLFFGEPAPCRPIDALADFLRATPSGKRLGQVAAFLKLPEEEARRHLETAIAQGRLRKTRGRYVTV